MKHNILKIFFCLIVASNCLAGCTNSGSASSVVETITDGIKDILNPDPTLEAVENKVLDIKSKLNQESAYVLTQEDLAFLKNEGLLTNENEIKGWVQK